MTATSATVPLRILGFAGSLRRASYNRALLRAALELAPPELAIEIFAFDGIPLYNEDVEKSGDPEPVARFKAAIAAADGLLIATPEYNFGVPGVLKNAIDAPVRARARLPDLAARGQPPPSRSGSGTAGRIAAKWGRPLRRRDGARDRGTGFEGRRGRGGQDLGQV